MNMCVVRTEQCESVVQCGLRGLVQTMFGKISVIVTLGGGGGGGGGRGCDVKKNFILRKYCFIIRNI